MQYSTNNETMKYIQIFDCQISRKETGWKCTKILISSW